MGNYWLDRNGDSEFVLDFNVCERYRLPNVITVNLSNHIGLKSVGMKKGATYVLMLVQDSTGFRTVTWSANFKWMGGCPPTLSTQPHAVDVLTFMSDGTNMYCGSFARMS
jgi:hypothetical protein